MGWFKKKNKSLIAPSNSNPTPMINSSISNTNVERVAIKMENPTAEFHDHLEFDENHATHFNPKKYRDVKNIADTFIRFKQVTVKLTLISRKDRKRLLDFLTGVMYGLDGDYKQLEKNIYFFWIEKRKV